MTFYVNDIFLPVNHHIDDVYSLAIKKSGVAKDNIKNICVRKKSVDARGNDVKFVYSVSITLFNKVKLKKDSKIVIPKDYSIEINCKLNKNERPIIVGLGPAGLFCAYLLVLYGIKPIIFELGKPVDERIKDVDLFFQKGIFNENSNVQFGEGGAGTFSDGKLTTRINDTRCNFVLETFHKFGADENILYESHPHIGTDKLTHIIKKIREFIAENGGEVHFKSEVCDLLCDEKGIKGVVLKNGEKVFSRKVVLAVGHSSRKMFELLKNKNILMEKKPFSVGVRIEHLREFIDEKRYGKYAGHKNLGSAEYQFSKRENNRGCYTFCMCPGGQVIASNSEENMVVTNGMSKSDRLDINSNSAVVASVLPEDLDSDIMSGVYYQKKLEKLAYEYGGKDYIAPCQLSKDFLNDTISTKFYDVKPSYPLGTSFCNFNDIFDKKISDMLKIGLASFDEKIKGFSYGSAVLTGIETRTSSPLRILRGENLNSVSISGLYPAGEGAGYAGGITSAAVDGLRIAQAILEYEN
ncbi:MAG: hypothetical protein IKZ35_03905 [Clostridia bacterium]|nr:hypothetical protein [Clostridia bacterium]